MAKNKDNEDQVEDKKSKEPVAPVPTYENAFSVPSAPEEAPAPTEE